MLVIPILSKLSLTGFAVTVGHGGGVWIN